GDQPGEQSDEMPGHALDRGDAEEVGAVLPDGVEPTPLLIEVQAEVEFRGALGHLERLDVDAGEGKLHRSGDDELVERLKDRVPAGVPPRGVRGQTIEGELLMGDR